MGRFIIKIKDRYLEWSTIVDAPRTFGMTLDELREYIKEEYGNEGLRELPARLERVKQKGTSAYGYESLEETVSLNHAGPAECHLTLDELYHAYCLHKPIRNGWTADDWPKGEWHE